MHLRGFISPASSGCSFEEVFIGRKITKSLMLEDLSFQIADMRWHVIYEEKNVLLLSNYFSVQLSENVWHNVSVHASCGTRVVQFLFVPMVLWFVSLHYYCHSLMPSCSYCLKNIYRFFQTLDSVVFLKHSHCVSNCKLSHIHYSLVVSVVGKHTSSMYSVLSGLQINPYLRPLLNYGVI